MRNPDFRPARALVSAILIVMISPVPVLAQSPTPAQAAPALPVAASQDPDAALQTARDLIKSGDYDRAIQTLRGVIGEAKHRVETLREAYLLLIQTFVYVGNDLWSKEQGRESARLNYLEARSLIKECLEVKELRHTSPEPDSIYPKEMVTAFREVRSQIFGAFRVTELTPPGAVVLFDADTLRSLPGEETLGDVNLKVGRHLVVVRYPGYRDLTEEITIAPGVTESRPYELTRHRGPFWYAARAGAALGLVGGLVAILVKPSGGDGPPAATPLSEPPPPPTRAR